jgi:hypothetical protein
MDGVFGKILRAHAIIYKISCTITFLLQFSSFGCGIIEIVRWILCIHFHNFYLASLKT